MSAKTTPWFKGSIKPARIGVYQARERDGSAWFNYWDGKDWHFGASDVCDAMYWNPMSSRGAEECVAKWRGLASKP